MITVDDKKYDETKLSDEGKVALNNIEVINKKQNDYFTQLKNQEKAKFAATAPNEALIFFKTRVSLSCALGTERRLERTHLERENLWAPNPTTPRIQRCRLSRPRRP